MKKPVHLTRADIPGDRPITLNGEYFLSIMEVMEGQEVKCTEIRCKTDLTYHVMESVDEVRKRLREAGK